MNGSSYAETEWCASGTFSWGQLHLTEPRWHPSHPMNLLRKDLQDSNGQRTSCPFSRLPTSPSYCHWVHWSLSPRWVCCLLLPQHLGQDLRKDSRTEDRIGPHRHVAFGQTFLLWTLEITVPSSQVIKRDSSLSSLSHQVTWPWGCHYSVLNKTPSLLRHTQAHGR